MISMCKRDQLPSFNFFFKFRVNIPPSFICQRKSWNYFASMVTNKYSILNQLTVVKTSVKCSKKLQVKKSLVQLMISEHFWGFFFFWLVTPGFFSLLLRFKCKRCINNIQVRGPPEGTDCNSDLSQWHHCADKKGLSDTALKTVWTSSVSFVFHHWSHEEQRKTA